jgi:peroxiredoxin
MADRTVVGASLPDIALPSTQGTPVTLASVKGTSVLFIYPYTGRPGHPNPLGWDDIPGAHGSTPQALCFSKSYDEFQTLHVKVFGLSFATHEWQQDFASRNNLRYALLSDHGRTFAAALNLSTFKAGGENYLTRRCFIIRDGVVIHDIFPVTSPAENAHDVLRILKA